MMKKTMMRKRRKRRKKRKNNIHYHHCSNRLRRPGANVCKRWTFSKQATEKEERAKSSWQWLLCTFFLLKVCKEGLIVKGCMR